MSLDYNRQVLTWQSGDISQPHAFVGAISFSQERRDPKANIQTNLTT